MGPMKTGTNFQNELPLVKGKT